MSDDAAHISRPIRPVKAATNSAEWRRYKDHLRAWKNARLEKQLDNIQAEELSEQQPSTSSITTSQTIKGRSYTLSIALPASILRNAQSSELRTYLAGQIGRAACVFNIDEIIIFNDDDQDETSQEIDHNPFSASEQLIRLLEYLECPQYLRKQFFPRQKLLEYAGLLNPLDAPHHVRTNEYWFYREGVTLPLRPAEGKGSWVDVGLYETKIQIDKRLQQGLRVTVQRTDITQEEYFHTKETLNENPNINKKKRITGEIVSPSTPRLESGMYWGYQVRKAESIRTIIENCPFDDNNNHDSHYHHEPKYDLVIGTSERGIAYNEITEFPRFRHGLIVFGGLQGLEKAFEHEQDHATADKLFNYYINTCPQQGSRTIRTEEAILITLSCLREKLMAAAIN
ncbi:unnamed protein product [Adineta steineri]|uniref:Uncharacterized protein n=2 Tax=Adineta steineri TaxID=433720 RepID=A0A815D8K4_9BILA|nr:unnamed protein product [Adineta steineri]CAF3902697.1 unnamed protein product [Adineta steineri]